MFTLSLVNNPSCGFSILAKYNIGSKDRCSDFYTIKTLSSKAKTRIGDICPKAKQRQSSKKGKNFFVNNQKAV